MRTLYVMMAVAAQGVILGAISYAAFLIFPRLFGAMTGTVIAVAIATYFVMSLVEFVSVEMYGRAIFGVPLRGMGYSLTEKFMMTLMLWVVIGLVVYQVMTAPS